MFPDLSHLSGHMYEWAAQMSENSRGVVGPAQVSSWHGRGMVGPAWVSRGARQGCGEVWAVR